MLYFAYGANVNSRNIRRTAPRARALSPARLGGYRLVFKGFAGTLIKADATEPASPACSTKSRRPASMPSISTQHVQPALYRARPRSRLKA